MLEIREIGSEKILDLYTGCIPAGAEEAAKGAGLVDVKVASLSESLQDPEGREYALKLVIPRHLRRER